MVWIVVANVPRSREQAATWDPSHQVNCLTRGTTVNENWWWAFHLKKEAQRAMATIMRANEGNGMRLSLKEYSKIPSGWE